MSDELAPDAFFELANLFDSVPQMRPIVDAVAKAKPESFWTLVALSQYMTAGGDEDAQLALRLLKMAQPNLENLAADQRNAAQAWFLYVNAVALLSRAEFGNRDVLPDARESLSKMIDLAPAESQGWPTIDDAYTTLAESYMSEGEYEKAAKEIESGLKESPESITLTSTAFLIRLAQAREEDAKRLAEEALKLSNKATTDEDRAAALFPSAVIRVLLDHKESEESARAFIETKDANADYIRMMLYWRLCLSGNTDDAKQLLSDRWREIDRSTWSARLARGDVKAWREQLIGYYAEEVTREEIFGSLKNWEQSPLRALPVPLPGLLCEANFYDALLKHTKGRHTEYVAGLNEAVKTEHFRYYEYTMAKYLLAQLPTGK